MLKSQSEISLEYKVQVVSQTVISPKWIYVKRNYNELMSSFGQVKQK